MTRSRTMILDIVITLCLAICLPSSSSSPLAASLNQEETHSLVMGGNLASIEMLTPDSICTPDIPPLPVAIQYASAVFYHEKIFHCGSYTSTDMCHYLPILEEDAQWDEERSMVMERGRFSMTVIMDNVYAVGGFFENDDGSPAGSRDSVESYNEGQGWQVEPQMKLPSAKYEHCSVSLNDKQLVVIGGNDGRKVTSEVLSFDVENMSGGWTALPSMNTPRRYHACDTGTYEGHYGIFVTAGSGGLDEQPFYPSVEFYVGQEQQWRVLGELKTGRDSHSLSMVSGIPYVAGGIPAQTSVERFNGTTWVEAGRMEAGRFGHTAVDIPAGVVACKME